MAQIIKHRRGSIDSVKNSTSRKGELIMATGSVGNLNGPFVFIGTDEGSGLYSPASKLYAGSEAPTLTATTYGTTLDGTPFYASSNKSLYILNNSNIGNSQIDLTGNIEGNTISGVTINNLESTNVTASYFTGAFVGDASGLINIPASGVTGLNLSKIYSGSIQVTTDSETGEVHIDATNGVYVSGSTLDVKGDLVLTGSLFASNIHGTGSIYLYPDQGDSRYFEIYNTGMGDTHIKASGGYSFFGDDTNYLKIDDSLQIVSITGVNGVHVSSSLNVNGNTSVTGALVVSNGSATFDSGLVAQNSNMLLTSGSNLIVQNSGNVTVDYIQGNTEQWNYLALNGGAVGASGVELSSATNISLWAEGGTVNVTGSLNVTGDIIFSGSINLGDFTGDTINFNGEVSSSILPQTGSSFDLGASGQTWNNVWAENAHFTNISLNSIAFEGLTEGRVVTVGDSGSLVDYSGFTFDGTNLNVSGAIEVTNIQGTGSLYLQPDKTDSRLFEIYNTSSGDVHLKGIADYSFFGDDTNYLQINNLSDEITLQSNNQLNLKSQNSSVYLESNDGTVYINDDSGNNTRIGGNTYINDNLYVNRIYDDNDNFNYLQLDGWNTDDGYWWEGGDGNDTTLLNNTSNANVNILQTNSGDVNIDATGGSVNIHSANGMNVTGSLIVSDASGVFNSSLNVNNSNLTLDSGSNLVIENNGTLTVDGQADFHDNVYVSGNTHTDEYRGLTNNTNVLYMNGGGLSPDVELASEGQISLWAEGNNSNSGIHLTGSVYSNDHMYINNGNRLYTNYISDNGGDDLNINTDGGLYLYSDSTREIQLSTNNAESGTNYINVNNNNVYLSTYDFTSGLTHKVLLDNTGSLKLENVSLSLTGSLNVSGSLDVYGATHIHNDLYVSGNLAILGSGSVVHISSSQVDIGTNIINLNTFAPFERFAGLAVYDSGSNVGVTGSLLWDSQENVWIYSHPDHMGSVASARLISGPLNTGSIGNETGLTNGHFPIATGDDHISDSLLTYIGTTLALNTNKFTVDSESGDTLVNGNFTIEGVGASDNGEYSSYIVFRNDENVLGFVGTTDTGNETDRLLGYNASSGMLEFSSLIDGGTY